MMHSNLSRLGYRGAVFVITHPNIARVHISRKPSGRVIINSYFYETGYNNGTTRKYYEV